MTNDSFLIIICIATCGFSSSGRAPPCQGGGGEFESRNPLHRALISSAHYIRRHSQVVRQSSAKALSPVQIWVVPPTLKSLIFGLTKPNLGFLFFCFYDENRVKFDEIKLFLSILSCNLHKNYIKLIKYILKIMNRLISQKNMYN